MLKDSSGPKNNWVDSQNSSPSHREKPLQCHAPTQPPLFRNFGTANVPPALRCLHKSGFPLRDFWGCRQHLVPREPVSTTWSDWAPPQGCIYPNSVHCYYSKGRQGWNIRGCCSLQSRNPVISQQKPPLVQQTTGCRLYHMSCVICCTPRTQKCEDRPQPPITWRQKDLLSRDQRTQRSHEGKAGKRSPSAAVN